MSTRCNLLVQDNIKGEHILYRHCDGMPDSAGKQIKEYLKEYVMNTNTTYNYEDISNGIIDNLGFEDEGTVAKDINYFYEIIVHPNTIFYTCYHVPVFGNYDIDNIEEYPDCETVECEEFNKFTIPKETIDNTKEIITDSKDALKYVEERNNFLNKLIEKYTNDDNISKDVFKESLKIAYNQGYNNRLIDTI